MISKKYRLKQREVRKVLAGIKPFFSYDFVLKVKINKKDFNRFAIVIWSKSVKNNVIRNHFRRLFYRFIKKSYLYLDSFKSKNKYDLVFILKKQTKLDKYDKKTIVSFENNLVFLEKKLRNNL